MLRIGLFGVGHLGKIHLKCIRLATTAYELVGFYDPDPATAARVSEETGVRSYTTPEALIDEVDVVDIVTPTITHHQMALMALSRGKHVFIEKPLTHTLAEAEELMEISQSQGLLVQVGHVERFNPALLALDDTVVDPMFIEAHRLSIFNPRGTDVSVVLDLMIHDLDIILSMIPAELTGLHANGVAVVSAAPDIANARLEFANGCVANLTASRISLKQMRKVRLFQRDAYISLDFLEKEAQVVRLFDAEDAPSGAGESMILDTATGRKHLHVSMPPIEAVNAIKMELEYFADSIRTGQRPRVSIEDGYRALKLAHQISQHIDERNAKLIPQK